MTQSACKKLFLARRQAWLALKCLDDCVELLQLKCFTTLKVLDLRHQLSSSSNLFEEARCRLKLGEENMQGIGQLVHLEELVSCIDGYPYSKFSMPPSFKGSYFTYSYSYCTMTLHSAFLMPGLELQESMKRNSFLADC